RRGAPLPPEPARRRARPGGSDALGVAIDQSAVRPTSRSVTTSTTAPAGRHSHHGAPKPTGSNPMTMDAAPTTSAYGNCVRTCAMWSQPDAIDLRMVVSDSGEQWSPHTAPASTDATDAYRTAPSAPPTAHASGTTSGIRMPIVPQL